MIQAIVFSYNRAMQLHALLESIDKNAYNLFDYITISYNYSNDDYKEGYSWLSEEGFADEWESHKKVVHTTKFRDHLLSLIDVDYPYTALLCDDSIVYDKMDRDDVLGIMDSVFTFSPRLGLNVVECYTHNCENNLGNYVDMGDTIKWKWRQEKLDFGYPLTIDGNIYKTIDILNLLNKISVTSPPRLEGELNKFKKHIDGNWMGSYKTNRLVSIPVNKVQTDYPDNRVGEKFAVSAKELNDKYLDGYTVNLDKMDFSNITGSHQELNLVFKKEK